MAADGQRGNDKGGGRERCFCGHYRSEHEDGRGRCHGAYATLMADADDFESVEVLCHCNGFWVPPGGTSFEVRS